MRISDWSSDVCSSDLKNYIPDWKRLRDLGHQPAKAGSSVGQIDHADAAWRCRKSVTASLKLSFRSPATIWSAPAMSTTSACGTSTRNRSEEHTSELQSLIRTSYAVFCLKKKKQS